MLITKAKWLQIDPIGSERIARAIMLVPSVVDFNYMHDHILVSEDRFEVSTWSGRCRIRLSWD